MKGLEEEKPEKTNWISGLHFVAVILRESDGDNNPIRFQSSQKFDQNAAGKSERRANASRHRLTQMRLPLDGFTRRTRLGIRISRDLCIELVKTESTKPRKQMRIEYLSDFLLSICFYFDSDRCKIAKMLLALPDFCFK